MLSQHAQKAEAAKLFDQLRQEIPLESPAAEKRDNEHERTPKSVYGALAAQNADMAGWLKIDGTPIDYPVMQTAPDGEYYLNRNFEKKYSAYGIPFADKASDLSPAGGNIIIYGHNMRDGQMFAPLLSFQDQAYWHEHRLIQFDTLEEFGLYRIVAVLKANASIGDPEAVDLTQYAGFDSEQEFNDFVSRCRELELYPTGESIQFQDRLLILSTCEYSEKNGRLIIIAQKVPM